MGEHFYLFFFMLNFSTGCIVKDERLTKVISGYTGGSVLLPCSCAQPQSSVNTFSWSFQRRDTQWIKVFEDKKYSGRLVLFNESSPTNLSLLISGLREEDAGFYLCDTTSPNSYTFVRLQVKGCDLVNKGSKFEVTGYSGESVVLPCSCTEPLVKPEQIQWMYLTGNNYNEIYPNEQTETHKNRVKLLNKSSPGNQSLIISALTTKDQGEYYCSDSSEQFVFFTLYVKEKPHVETTSFSTHGTSYQTQVPTPPQQTPTAPQQPPTAPQQPHHTPKYVYIVLGASLSVLALLVFLYWGFRGCRNVKKETSDGEELKKKDPGHQDDVMYSTVVEVKTASTASHIQNHPAELTEYATINVKR